MNEAPTQPAPEQQDASLQYAVVTIDGEIVIKFSRPVEQVGMTPAQSLAFGQALIRLARKEQRKSGPQIIRPNGVPYGR